MNIVITGYSGFIGRNLCERLLSLPDCNLLLIGRTTSEEILSACLRQADIVYHLAAVHRPKSVSEFTEINIEYFSRILNELQQHQNACPVILTSSVQAQGDTPYAKSKVAAENLLAAHCDKMPSEGIVYRLTNTFGRYARPNAHSVVATFCFNLHRGIPLQVHNPDTVLQLCYIDDVTEVFCTHLAVSSANGVRFVSLKKPAYRISLGELALTLTKFRTAIQRGENPQASDELQRRLLITYLSYGQ